MIRYADDFVILVRGTKAQAQALKEQTAEFMREQMRLTLSPEKTRSPTSTTASTCSGSASCGARGRSNAPSPTASQASERCARSSTGSRN